MKQYIDYFGRILNENYLQTGPDALTMIEPADGVYKEQRVKIKNASRTISDMKLYCFNTPDTNAMGLFPFFNQQTVGPNKAPHGLLSFCDYILLVQHDSGLFVYFIELKRGRHEGAEKQLEASSTFFDYILQTANRIKVENGFSDFDVTQVKCRKIIINEEYCNKHTTKPKDVREGSNMDGVMLHKCYKEFRPIDYCR